MPRRNVTGRKIRQLFRKLAIGDFTCVHNESSHRVTIVSGSKTIVITELYCVQWRFPILVAEETQGEAFYIHKRSNVMHMFRWIEYRLAMCIKPIKVCWQKDGF